MSRWLAGWLACWLARRCASHIFLPLPPLPLHPPPPPPPLSSFTPPTSAAPCFHSVLLALSDISPLFGYLSDTWHLWHRYASPGCVEIFWAYCRKKKCIRCHRECLLQNVSWLIVRVTYQSQWSCSYFWFALKSSVLVQFKASELESAPTLSTTTWFSILWSKANPSLRYLRSPIPTASL